MKHASLFSGIGGFDLAAKWMGWENVFQVEKDKFCQNILAKNFPHTKRYGDIKEFDGTKYRGTIDVITGGFPCQPFSSAGQRRGIADERHLWPEMCRVIREIAPTYIVGENVLGIANWSKGLVFEQVHTDLETEGYEVQTFILPAAGVNAPHQRYRVWFVAYSQSFGNNRTSLEGIKKVGGSDGKGNAESVKYGGARISDGWGMWPTKSGICGGNDGVPKRVDRIAALGNAIVPQVAFEIFKAIEETLNKTP